MRIQSTNYQNTSRNRGTNNNTSFGIKFDTKTQEKVSEFVKEHVSLISDVSFEKLKTILNDSSTKDIVVSLEESLFSTLRDKSLGRIFLSSEKYFKESRNVLNRTVKNESHNVYFENFNHFINTVDLDELKSFEEKVLKPKHIKIALREQLQEFINNSESQLKLKKLFNSEEDIKLFNGIEEGSLTQEKINNIKDFINYNREGVTFKIEQTKGRDILSASDKILHVIYKDPEITCEVADLNPLLEQKNKLPSTIINSRIDNILIPKYETKLLGEQRAAELENIFNAHNSANI